MSSVLIGDARPSGGGQQHGGFLSKKRIVATPGLNRWLVPPAALALHLCIGMAYGFLVFRLPLSKAIGQSAPQACPKDMSLGAKLFISECDWRISSVGWMHTLFFMLPGASPALWGGWLERARSRKAGGACTTLHLSESGANVIATDRSDWATNCPEYKTPAAQVTEAMQPSDWQREYAGFHRRLLDLLARAKAETALAGATGK